MFSQPFQASEHSLQVNATFGICRLRDAADQGMVIMKQVYIALNKAKKTVGSHHQYYEPAMEEEVTERLSMLRMLRADFALDKLELWYQPQLCLKTKKVVGMEALLRWPHQPGQYISPAVFIPLAEYSGLIVDIGLWVLEQACKQLQQLSAVGCGALRIAVNVSMPQFRSPQFVPAVIEIVERFQVKPQLLELEITESVVMDEPKIVIDALEALKRFGIKVAIDDFGIGFSSLSYLQQLPLDRIKVDRAFVNTVATEGGGLIAASIISLGKRIGLSTIAEGVETEAQLHAILAMGCDEVQGYLFAKPMPAPQLIEYLRQNQSGCIQF